MPNKSRQRLATRGACSILERSLISSSRACLISVCICLVAAAHVPSEGCPEGVQGATLTSFTALHGICSAELVLDKILLPGCLQCGAERQQSLPNCAAGLHSGALSLAVSISSQAIPQAQLRTEPVWVANSGAAQAPAHSLCILRTRKPPARPKLW